MTLLTVYTTNHYPPLLIHRMDNYMILPTVLLDINQINFISFFSMEKKMSPTLVPASGEHVNDKWFLAQSI